MNQIQQRRKRRQNTNDNSVQPTSVDSLVRGGTREILSVEADDSEAEGELEEAEEDVEDCFEGVAGAGVDAAGVIEGEHFGGCSGFVGGRGDGAVGVLLGFVLFGLGDADFEDFEEEEPHLLFFGGVW